MKKRLGFITILLFFLTIHTAIAAGTDEIMNLKATINGKRVSISGSAGKDGIKAAGKTVAVKVTDPLAKTVFAGTTICSNSGEFRITYENSIMTPGTYKVAVSMQGRKITYTTFEYGTNNRLSALSISKGGFDKGFSPENTLYNVKYDQRVGSISVTPTAEDSMASIKVNGVMVKSGSASVEIKLSEGVNSINITVASLEGKNKTYIINADRAKKLSTKMEAKATFAADRQLFVSGSISSGAGQAIALQVLNPKGTLEYAGNILSREKGSFSFKSRLSGVVNGRYTVKLKTLGLEETLKTYADYLELKSLSIGDLKLSPEFRSDVTFYTTSVKGLIDKIKVMPASTDQSAKITVNSKVVKSGSSSDNIELKYGSNKIEILLSGYEGKSTKTYTVVVAKDDGSEVKGTVETNFTKKKLVEVKGTAGTKPGRQITIKITNPEGKVDYAGTTKTGDGGAYAISYKLTGNITGRYNVLVGAKGFLKPLDSYFTFSSGDTDLESLEVVGNVIKPNFDKVKTEYEAGVKYDTDKVTILAKAKDAMATIKINDIEVDSGKASPSIKLNVGKNEVKVVVRTLDEKEKTYSIVITRAQSDNTALTVLKISEGAVSPAISTTVVNYAAEVSYKVGSVKIIAVPADEKAIVRVNGVLIDSTLTSGEIALKTGDNDIAVEVTAQDSSKKTYMIKVKRLPSGNAELKLIALSKGILSPVFANTLTSYTAQVESNISSLTVRAEADDAMAGVKINGKALNMGNSSEVNLSYGNNTISIEVTAQSGVKKTYEVVVKRKTPGNTNLRNITVSGVSIYPAFNAMTTSYNGSVDNSVDTADITAFAEDIDAVVAINGKSGVGGYITEKVILREGTNPINIEVRAQDGTNKAYSINITRAEAIRYPVLSDVNTLKSLILSSGELNPAFSPENTTYNVNVPSNTSTITITPVAASVLATIEVNGTLTASGTAKSINLKVGVNYINIVVKAENGIKKTYTIIIKRDESSDANLINLVPSIGSLDTAFSAIKTNYMINCASSVESITLTPTASESHAVIKVNNVVVESGSASGAISLEVGNNIIKILVTAQDGTTKTYLVNIVRAGSSDANLTGLVTDCGNFDTVFSAENTTYTVNCETSDEIIKVTPTASESHAIVRVNGVIVTSGSASGAIVLDLGNNIITVLVTAQDGTTKTYVMTVKRSDNATLNNLRLLKSGDELSGITPDFSKSIRNYIINVANEVDWILVSASLSDISSSLKINGVAIAIIDGEVQTSDVIPLIVGENIVTIEIKSLSGIVFTYTVKVIRAGNPNLTGISISGIGALNIIPVLYEYSATVDNNITSVKITPDAVDTSAVIKINGGTPIASGSESAEINLAVGENTITIEVATLDGSKRVYTIKITRRAT